MFSAGAGQARRAGAPDGDFYVFILIFFLFFFSTRISGVKPIFHQNVKL